VDAFQLSGTVLEVTLDAANPVGTVGACVSAKVVTPKAAESAEMLGGELLSKAATW